MNLNKSALICGVTNQAGEYLTSKLLNSGFMVIGTSSHSDDTKSKKLAKLGIKDENKVVSTEPSNFRSDLQIIKKHMQYQIYYMAGEKSVNLSFEKSYEAIATGCKNILEAIRILNLICSFFNAGSLECYEVFSGAAANEESRSSPIVRSDVAKATSLWTTVNSRRSYGIFAFKEILSILKSPLRRPSFVIKEIVDKIYKEDLL